jgi:hypothetical protein
MYQGHLNSHGISGQGELEYRYQISVDFRLNEEWSSFYVYISVDLRLFKENSPFFTFYESIGGISPSIFSYFSLLKLNKRNFTTIHQIDFPNR